MSDMVEYYYVVNGEDTRNWNKNRYKKFTHSIRTMKRKDRFRDLIIALRMQCLSQNYFQAFQTEEQIYKSRLS